MNIEMLLENMEAPTGFFQLMKDVANKSETPSIVFQKEGKSANANEVIRSVFQSYLGETPQSRLNTFKTTQGREKFFALVETVINIPLAETLLATVEGFGEFHDIELGQKKSFRYNDPTLFNVSAIAAGTNQVDRQRHLTGTFEVATQWYAIGTYAEFEQFLVGQIDFAALVTKCHRSIERKMGELIWNGINESYDYLSSAFGLGGNFDMPDLIEMNRKVSARAGGAQVINYVTLGAANRIARQVLGGPLPAAEHQVDEFHTRGFITRIEGLTFAVLPDIVAPSFVFDSPGDFKFDDNTILSVPAGDEKIIKVVREGEVNVNERSGTDRFDNQIEWNTTFKMGVAVGKTAIFGMYKFTS